MIKDDNKPSTPYYLKRMLGELRELSERRQALDDYLELGNDNLTSKEFAMMTDQLIVMVEYEDILSERIKFAKRKEGIE